MKKYVDAQAEQGTQVEPIGANDAMAVILGKDHPLRVCCLGFGVNPKRAFGTNGFKSTTSSTATLCDSELRKENQMLRGEVGDLQAKVVRLEALVEQLAHRQGLDALSPTPASVQENLMHVKQVRRGKEHLIHFKQVGKGRSISCKSNKSREGEGECEGEEESPF